MNNRIKIHLKLFVLVIIGLFFYINNLYCLSKDEYCISQITIFSEALEKYKNDTGSYPTTYQSLDALLKCPKKTINWKGPYIEKRIIPLDPWGNDFIYYYPSMYGCKQYDLYSSGENGIDEKGKGDDITNCNKINVIFYIQLISIAIICLCIFILIRYQILKLNRSNQKKVRRLG